MPRARLSPDEVLSSIHLARGAHARATASRLIDLAVSLGAQPWPRRKGVALRHPGKVGAKPDWLTLFVVSTAGTIYNNWHDRWRGAGVKTEAIKEYERTMIATFGDAFVSHPSAFSSAAPLTVPDGRWKATERAMRQAVKHIRTAVDARSNTDAQPVEPNSTALSALEGQLTETRVARRGRNAKLRRAALLRAGGTCAVCDVNFGALIGGRGRRVLQVHHRRQMSDRDDPEWTSVDDLDVVCANCHLLIHSDRDAPLPVDALRALWHS